MAETQLNISELARQSGYSRTTVRRRLKQGWTPDSLDAVAPIKIPENVHDVATPSTKASPRGGYVPVDLRQLKRDVQEWTKLHNEIDRFKAKERRNHISWQVCRYSFLSIGVGFYFLIGFAAIAGH